MKYLKKHAAVLAALSFTICLTSACSDDEPDFEPDARISMTAAKEASAIVAQPIGVDAMENGFFNLRVSITGKGGSHTFSVNIDSMQDLAVTSGDLLTDDTIQVDVGDTKQFDLRLPPGSYTILQDGERTAVNIGVFPYGTHAPPAEP